MGGDVAIPHRQPCNDGEIEGVVQRQFLKMGDPKGAGQDDGGHAQQNGFDVPDHPHKFVSDTEENRFVNGDGHLIVFGCLACKNMPFAFQETDAYQRNG